MLALLVVAAMILLAGWILQLVLRYTISAEGPYWWCVGMVVANGVASAIANALLGKMVDNETAVTLIALPLNFLIFSSIIKFVTETEWKQSFLAAAVATVAYWVLGFVLAILLVAIA